MGFAQNEEVTLMVSSDGPTKDEAVKTALRSAIEQAYGTFVSASTEILNDEVIKDEIITVTQGNIKNYNEVASYQQNDGRFFVTLQATVSISKLVSYAQSKGAKTEFAGAAFAMDLKMKLLNKENEATAIKSMLNEMKILLKNGFKHEIDIRNVKADGEVLALITTTLTPDGIAAWNLFESTLKGLSLSEKEDLEYTNLGLNVYRLGINNNGQNNYYNFRNESIAEMIRDFVFKEYIPEAYNFDIVTNIKTMPIRIVAFDKVFDNSNNQPIKAILSVNYVAPFEGGMWGTWKKYYYCLSEGIYAHPDYVYMQDIDDLNKILDFSTGVRMSRGSYYKRKASYEYSQNREIVTVFYTFKYNSTFYNAVNMMIPLEDLGEITSFEVRHRAD